MLENNINTANFGNTDNQNYSQEIIKKDEENNIDFVTVYAKN